MASTYELIIQAVDKTRGPLKGIERNMGRLDRKAGQVTSTLKGAGVAIAAFASGSVMRGLVNQFTAFEKARSVIATYTGSQEKANREMVRLQKLANDLAQDLPDITNAFKILTTRGIDTSSASLKAFSNVATANSKSFSQLGEAIADALTGEFERLKEFGIKATKENDKVVAQFADGSKKSFNSYKDFVEGVKQLGTAEGLFGSASANNANTLAQAFSNLAGKYNEAAIEFGKGAKGGLKTFTTTITLLIDQNKELIRTIGEAVGAIATGLAKAIAFAANNADKLSLAIKVLVAYKVGMWMTAAAVATLRFSKALTATGVAAAATGKLLKRNIIGLVIAGGVAVADMTGLLDKLFASTEGGGGESSPINSLLKQIRTVNMELEKYQDGGSSIGKALTNSTFPLAEALAMEQIALENSIKVLERKLKTELAGNIINAETIKQLDQQKNKLGEIKGVLTDFMKLQEAASGPMRITIGLTKDQKAAGDMINDSLGPIRKISELNRLRTEIEKQLAAGIREKTITEVESAAVLDKLFPKKKADLTLEQQLLKNYEDSKKELTDLLAIQSKVGELSQGNAEKQAFLNQQVMAGLEANDLYKKSALTTAQVIDEGFKTAVGSLPKELSTAIVKGENLFKTLENSFNRMLENILQQILESQIQSALTQLFAPSGGGGGSSNFLATAASFLFGAPGKAVGGPVAGGQPYMVGEQGPELFMPNTAGQIVSNSELNSGGGGAVVNFNINAIDTQTGVEFLLENKKNIIGMVSQGYNQRGRQGITS